jgi:hypothetical protein
VVGAGVAAAVYLSPNLVGGRGMNVLLAIPFWPLYLPLLLARQRAGGMTLADSLPDDNMTAAIRQVDVELSAMFSTLEEWGIEVQPEKERLSLLRKVWISQAERIRAMDRLLAVPDDSAGAEEPARARGSQLARQENLERLRQVRHQTFDDLMARLAWVREVVSKIHLARFTGEPVSRARELLAQIVASGDLRICNAQHVEPESGIRRA